MYITHPKVDAKTLEGVTASVALSLPHIALLMPRSLD